MKDMKDDEDKKPAKGGKKRVLDDLKSTNSRDTTPSAAGDKKGKLSIHSLKLTIAAKKARK